MTRFKMTTRAWVSPESGEPTRSDTRKVSDDRGNEIELDRLSASRPKNRLLKWIQSTFGS